MTNDQENPTELVLRKDGDDVIVSAVVNGDEIESGQKAGVIRHE